MTCRAKEKAVGFIENYKKASKGEPLGSEFVVGGAKVTCSHCDTTLFLTREVLLNTAGLTFLNLGWANEGATVLVCEQCGKLEWFLSEPEKLS